MTNYDISLPIPHPLLGPRLSRLLMGWTPRMPHSISNIQLLDVTMNERVNLLPAYLDSSFFASSARFSGLLSYGRKRSDFATTPPCLQEAKSSMKCCTHGPSVTNLNERPLHLAYTRALFPRLYVANELASSPGQAALFFSPHRCLGSHGRAHRPSLLTSPHRRGWRAVRRALGGARSPRGRGARACLALPRDPARDTSCMAPSHRGCSSAHRPGGQGGAWEMTDG